jgi:hypothetical protein
MATLTRVQHNSMTTTSTTATNFNTTLSSGDTAGNLLVATIVLGTSGLTLTPPAGWTQAGSSEVVSGSIDTRIYYLVVSSGGTSSFNWSFGATAHSFGWTIDEWNSSTGWQASPVDSSAGAVHSTASTAVNCGSPAATTQASELWFGVLAWASSGQTLSGITSGWSTGDTAIFTSNNEQTSFFQIASATGTPSLAATLSASVINAGVVATFVPNAASAAVLPPAVATPPGRFSPSSLAPLRPGIPALPTPYTEADPAAATATATALQPAVAITPAPAAASATATALSPAVTASATVTPGTATATATAQGPVPNVIPHPPAASATATAQGPAILTGTIVTPGVATATATAQSPAVQVSPTVTPGVATATAAALQPAVVITPGAGLAHAVATAQSPAISLSTVVTPGLAHATATASSPGFATGLTHFAVTFTEQGLGAVLTGNGLGAVLSGQKLGAALTLPGFGGSLVPVRPSATCTIQGYGATLVLSGLGAVITGGTMQQASLTLSEFNDMTINIAVTNNGSPYNLTSQNLNLLLKSQAGVPDNQALVFSSSGGSPAITITNASQGLATAQLPNVDLDAETYNFYRLDVVNASSQQQTTVYGPIIWVTL